MAEAPRTGGFVELQQVVSGEESKALWVFGYGSLCWRPGFCFHKAVVGYVRGYSRRFWQGNTTHRGTDEKPGRVATLVEDKTSIVHGVAFAISGEAALPYLQNRECTLGGYMTQFTKFYPLIGDPINVLLYIATPTNPLWMGEAPMEDMARQISETRGDSGYNAEYLLRLADFMRFHFPGEEDYHLFALEKEVMQRIDKHNMCLKTLMGDGKDCVKFIKQMSASASPHQEQQEQVRVDTFQYTARVPGKKLRCLNI